MFIDSAVPNEPEEKSFEPGIPPEKQDPETLASLRGPDRPDAVLRNERTVAEATIGIYGANGFMGADIARLFGACGAQVSLMGRSATKLEKLSSGFVEHVSQSGFRARFDPSTRPIVRVPLLNAPAAECDLIIESVAEDPGLKKQIFQKLSRDARSDAVIASNTSSIPIETFVDSVVNPERLVGLHFYAPMEKRRLIEIIPCSRTEPEVLEQMRRWVEDVGGIPIVAKDSPGFLGNRIYVPHTVEAQHLFGEGYSVSFIDELVHEFGMEVGPFEFVDVVGGDTADSVLTSFIDQFGENSRYACPRWGEKAKRWNSLPGARLSFYQPVGIGSFVLCRNLLDSKLIRNMIFGTRCKKILTETSSGVNKEELRDRLVLPVVNEAYRYLAEACELPGSDRDFEKQQIDTALVHGYGFPGSRGGPLAYAEQRGIGDIVARLEALQARYGARFRPCGELYSLVGRSET